jgi:hypothetical protein
MLEIFKININMYHFLGSTDHFLDEANEILKLLWVVWLNI